MIQNINTQLMKTGSATDLCVSSPSILAMPMVSKALHQAF